MSQHVKRASDALAFPSSYADYLERRRKRLQAQRQMRESQSEQTLQQRERQEQLRAQQRQRQQQPLQRSGNSRHFRAPLVGSAASSAVHRSRSLPAIHQSNDGLGGSGGGGGRGSVDTPGVRRAEHESSSRRPATFNTALGAHLETHRQQR
jgi:hypothetical protein